MLAAALTEWGAKSQRGGVLWTERTPCIEAIAGVAPVRLPVHDYTYLVTGTLSSGRPSRWRAGQWTKPSLMLRMLNCSVVDVLRFHNR